MNTNGMFFNKFENGTTIVAFIIICIVFLLISIWLIRWCKNK
ncbi:hypothetical protein [Campylobacter sputorum]|nr:hypothetical protein [Campylobacter sputorum]